MFEPRVALFDEAAAGGFSQLSDDAVIRLLDDRGGAGRQRC
jgi:hypothetical protein